MRTTKALASTTLVLGSLLLAASGTARAAEKIEFTLVPNFLQVPADITLGGGSAVAVDDKGDVYFFHRGKSPLLKFDKNGKFIRAWGDDLISRPHAVRIDKEQNVWLSCTGHHLVLKYSPEGKLLLTLGTADKPGLGNDQFNRPTDIAFGPKGQVYISDGYGNARVMEFDPRGAFVKTWGKPGDGPGEFNLPHAIRVDAKGRILVGDRTNNRIQVFDADGKLLDIWTGLYPCGLEIDRDGTIFVADPNAQQIVQLDPDGKIVHKWGERGTAIGQFDGCHMLGVDPKGDLYVAEVEGKRMQKFARKR